MAPVVLFSFTIRDAKTIGTARVKNKQTVGVYVPSTGLAMSDIDSLHDALATAIDGVTDGVVEGSAVTLYPDLPSGLKPTPVAGSDVQEGGLLTLSVTGSNYSEGVRIPAYKSSLQGADGQSIANSGATATLVTLLTGGGTPAIAASDKFGNDLVAYIAGKKSFRK